MQSGISVSKELGDKFNDLLVSQFNVPLAQTSTFGLLVTIEKEALVTKETLPATGGDFNSNLAQLAPHLEANPALYIIVRRYDVEPRLEAITYITDTAHPRSKTLFASTRLSLMRELGTEHFRESKGIYVNTAQELTPEGFDKIDKHTALAAPLTEEERTLGEVKRAEAEAGAGTGRREIHLSKNMNMPINEDALQKLTELGKGEGSGLVMLKINKETEIVELVPDASTPSSITELVGSISPTEPRFTFFRFAHTHEGAQTSPTLFFYTCPTEAAKAIKYRMMYPLMKRAVITAAEQHAGVSIEKKFEVEDPTEITEDSVLSDLHPRQEVKTGFRRPKRPGR